jgi:nuclear pore complex protein Nup188
MVMTERMRKGLTGEISSELKAVPEKARALLLAKSQQMAGGNKGGTDISNVLLGLLNQRVIGSRAMNLGSTSGCVAESS